MKNSYLIIISIIILIIVLFAYLFGFTSIENMDSIYTNMAIGNYLSVYFAHIGQAIARQTDFETETTYKGIFKDLPTKIIYNETPLCIEVYNSFKQYNIIEYAQTLHINESTWFNDTNELNYFWISLRPLVNSILNELFSNQKLKGTDNTNKIFIHIRCSDAPFHRHVHYHLCKYSFYKTALDKIRNKGITHKNICILSNINHGSSNENQQACTIYVKSIINMLTDYGYNVEISLNNEYDDFLNMFYADAVIAGSSSFSFMAGFFGNGIYYTIEKETSKIDNLDEWVIPNSILLHGDVPDYYDTDHVISLLSQ